MTAGVPTVSDGDVTTSGDRVLPENCPANCTSIVECIQVCVLEIESIQLVNAIFSWVTLPIIILFILPFFLMALIYVSSFFAFM